MNIFKRNFLPNIPGKYSIEGYHNKQMKVDTPIEYMCTSYRGSYSKPKVNPFQGFLINNISKEETTKINGPTIYICSRGNAAFKATERSYLRNALNSSIQRRSRNLSQVKVDNADNSILLHSFYRPKNEIRQDKTRIEMRPRTPIYNRTSYGKDDGYSNKIRTAQKQKITPNIKECPLCHKTIERYKINYHLNSHPSQILPWLFLGSYKNACDKNDLRTLNIAYVLNCAYECISFYPKNIKYKHLKMYDHPGFTIYSFLDKAIEFIQEAKNNNCNILVHCQMGISRSTTCVLAYLIAKENFDINSGLQFIKKKRKIVMPNYGFMQQLTQYQKNIRH